MPRVLGYGVDNEIFSRFLIRQLVGIKTVQALMLFKKYKNRVCVTVLRESFLKTIG